MIGETRRAGAYTVARRDTPNGPRWVVEDSAGHRLPGHWFTSREAAAAARAT